MFMYKCSPKCTHYNKKEECKYYSYKYKSDSNNIVEYCSRSKVKNFFSLLKHSQEYIRYYILNRAVEERQRYFEEGDTPAAAQTANAGQIAAKQNPSLPPATQNQGTPDIKNVYRSSFSNDETILSKFIALISEQNQTLQEMIKHNYSVSTIATAQEQVTLIMDMMKPLFAGKEVPKEVLDNILKFSSPSLSTPQDKK